MNENLPAVLLDPARFPGTQTILREKRNDRYHDISWDSLRRTVHARARGLLGRGLHPGDRVAILAPNSPQWAYADLAILSAGGITVPIYQTEGIETLLYILQDSGSRFLFLQAPSLAKELLGRLAEVEQLESIILLDEAAVGGRALSLAGLETAGAQVPPEAVDERIAAIDANDVATIVYTSGTTGTPKGVMLTHANLLSDIRACLQRFEVSAADQCLSFLPLSHTFERTTGYYLMLHQGATIAYAESVDRVPVNLPEVRPTVVISVPRLYEKMYARIHEQVLAGPWPKRLIFRACVAIGRACAARLLAGRPLGPLLGIGRRLAQALVFHKLQQRLGGRLRFFVSGGAPLGKHLAEFFLAADVPIYEGYGLTETSPVISANYPGHLKPGTVGPPLPGIEVRLAEDGEILVRGPSVFRSYWNRPEETAEALQNGWFHTGDIGQLDDDGFLAITDRKKELIVTAGGKKIPPQEVENLLKSDRFIANAMVYGDGMPFLVGLLVPDFTALEQYAHFKKIDHLNTCDLVQHPRSLDLIRRRVDKLQQHLAPYQRIKRFTLISRDFAQEHGELTPTLKLRRRDISRRFAPQLESMYAPQDHGVHDYGFCTVDSQPGD